MNRILLVILSLGAGFVSVGSKAESKADQFYKCEAICMLTNPGLIGARNSRSLAPAYGSGRIELFNTLKISCTEYARQYHWKLSELVVKPQGAEQSIPATVDNFCTPL